MYDPLDRDLDHDYKQLDPLLTGELPYSVNKISTMGAQDAQPPKDSMVLERLHKTTHEFQREAKPSPMQFVRQVRSTFR